MDRAPGDIAESAGWVKKLMKKQELAARIRPAV